jgi:hypothetical protein
VLYFFATAFLLVSRIYDYMVAHGR